MDKNERANRFADLYVRLNFRANIQAGKRFPSCLECSTPITTSGGLTPEGKERRVTKDVADASTPLEVPTRFRTILADPPWDHQQQGLKGAEQHYRLMSLKRIKEMPITELAENDAHLWLWVTNASLRDGYDVAEAWGFTPRSILTWVKFRLGLGAYLRNSTEHLLFCTRGKAPVSFKSQPTWINAPVQEHSRKPDEQYAVIERISTGPYLELFARRQPPSTRDWFVWGNQIDADISIPGYWVPNDEHHQGHNQHERR